ncbi:MAG: hypothetical protein ACLR6O_04840 [Eubacterium sp.]
MDEVFNLMESGEYAFMTYYAGDYVLMNETTVTWDIVFRSRSNAFMMHLHSEMF